MQKNQESLELAALITIIYKALDRRSTLDYKYELTHLKLQKLIWFCYLEYFHQYKKQLVKEDFEAWEYGPVLVSVFKVYNKYRATVITDNQEIKSLAKKYAFKFDTKITDLVINICVNNTYQNVRSLVVKSYDHFWDEYYNKGYAKMPWLAVKKYYG